MEDRPLINKLLEIDEYKERYHNYLQEIVDGYFTSGVFEETVFSIDEKINEYVKKDTTSFISYEQYESSLPVLIEFGKLRAKSINGQLNGSVPTTREEQKENQDLLVNASHINLSDLGRMMDGRGFGGSNRQEGPPENHSGFSNNQDNPLGNRDSITRSNREYIGITIFLLLFLVGVFIFIYKAKKNY